MTVQTTCAERAPSALTAPAQDPWSVIAATGSQPSPPPTDVAAALHELGLPAAPVPRERRSEIFERNVEALRSIDAWTTDDEHACRAAFDRSLSDDELLEANDGEVVLRRAAEPDPANWLWRRPFRSLANGAVAKETADQSALRALLVLGVSTPWAVLASLAVAERMSSGPNRFRCFVVHADLQTLAIGLSIADLTAAIRHPGFEFFLGAAATDRLSDWFERRPEAWLPKRAVVTPTDQPDASLAQAVLGVTRGAHERQTAATDRTVAAVHARYASITPLESRERLVEGVEGRRVLRILLPTTRRTSYLRFSVEDLAASLSALGHDARVLIEPTEHDSQTPLSMAKGVLDFQPDLVISPNAPRSVIGSLYPPSLPYVCWIQDAMGYIFDADVGRAQLDTDVLIGNTMPELVTTYAYPAHAALPYPTPASGRKFHRDEIDAERRKRFTCDIAFASNHSEPPSAMALRLATSIGLDRAMFGPAVEAAQRLAAAAATISVTDAVIPAAGKAYAQGLGRAMSPKQVSLLAYHFILPLAGRIFRHDTVEAAIRIADRRGWKLKLYGAGWDRSERFAPFAAGPVEHGEDLRACYACAAAHLHIDLMALTHQRVFECAFSGGLAVSAFQLDALATTRYRAREELLASATPRSVNDATGERTFALEDAPSGRAMIEQRAKFGLPPITDITCPKDLVPRGDRYRDVALPAFDVCGLLGDVASVAFTDESSLEAVLDRAINDRSWRDATSADIARRASGVLSTDAFAKRLLEHAAKTVAREAHHARTNQPWPPADSFMLLRDEALEAHTKHRKGNGRVA
ncbi:MAG: hypothetical protein CMJ31_12330 [Phycisphaerae bacterium]|nr:hypothetical protein [Phycisphaerae bacterium]